MYTIWDKMMLWCLLCVVFRNLCITASIFVKDGNAYSLKSWTVLLCKATKHKAATILLSTPSRNIFIIAYHYMESSSISEKPYPCANTFM